VLSDLLTDERQTRHVIISKHHSQGVPLPPEPELELAHRLHHYRTFHASDGSLCY
jgi:hypothetical protein